MVEHVKNIPWFRDVTLNKPEIFEEQFNNTPISTMKYTYAIDEFKRLVGEYVNKRNEVITKDE